MFSLCIQWPPFIVRFYIWEILHSTIRKMNKHVQKIQKELEEVKARLDKQHNKKVGKGFNKLWLWLVCV